MDDNFVVKRILELCEKKHMSQYELAKRAGMTQSSISTIISRGSMPKISTLEQICKGFGITLAQFFTVDGSCPDLSDEQLKALDMWESLSGKEKIALEGFVDILKDMR